MMVAQYPRSPKVLLGGMAHLPRLIDKIRLRQAGGIPDYHYLTSGFDKALIDWLQVDPQALEQRVLAGGTDEEILVWIREHGRAVDEVLAQRWTERILESKPQEPEALDRYRQRLEEVAAKRGVPFEALPVVTTWVEAIDLDEERL